MKAEIKKIYSYIIDGKLQIEMVIDDYTNYIYKIIRNFCINISDEDIEEITLDVFLTVWKNQNKLDINKNMSSYIGGITKNLIKKKNRNIKINENIEDYQDKLVDLTNVELFFSESEKQRIIRNELNNLKQIDKEIFIYYYYEENNIKEIARKFDISESRVKSKLFRIRKKLKKVLKERGYDSNEK